MALMKKSRESNPKLLSLCVTGTPFENNITELFSLFELSNTAPEKSRENLNTLIRIIDTAKDRIMGVANKNDDDLAEFSISFYKQMRAFSQFCQKRTLVVKRTDERVGRDWEGNIPTRIDKKIAVILPQDIKTGLDTLVRLNLKKPNLSDLSFKFLSDNGIISKTVIESSDFADGIRNKEKLIILVHRFDTIENFKKEFSEEGFSEKFPNVKLLEYHGKMDAKERENTIKSFTDNNDQATVLLLMDKAGGVGLNLPNARKMFIASSTLNPGVLEQAIARMIRVNSVGERTVFKPEYQDTYFQLHINSIIERKNLMAKLLLDATLTDTERFEVCLKYLRAEVKHAFLLDRKDEKSVENEMQKIDLQLKTILEFIEEDDLK